MWVEVFRRFGKENSAMNAKDVYAGDRFPLFIDLGSTRDNDLHANPNPTPLSKQTVSNFIVFTRN